MSGTGSGAFLADEAKPAGIYAHIGGSLVLGADKKTGIPGGEGKSTGFSDPVSLGGRMSLMKEMGMCFSRFSIT